MNKLPYELKVLLFSYAPTFGINLILRPFWSSDPGANTGLAILSVALTVLILPFYLLTVNYELAKKHQAEQFILNGLIVVSCVIISSYFHFYNWADSIGDRNNPDGGTEAVMSFEQWGGSTICVIGTIIGHYRITSRNKNTGET
jgi:hypothetical protein